jgi:2'-5' RNA ligase
MRLFVGSLLGPSHQRFYSRFIEEAVQRFPGALRSVPEHSVHFTHVFCADAPDERLGEICRAVTQAAGAHQPCEIRLGCPRVMAARSNPRLVCADVVSGLAQLAGLAATVFHALTRACPELTLSPSRTPHVTLARFRKQASRADGQQVSRWLAAREGKSGADRNMWIDEVQVVASELTARGPVYQIKAQCRLTHES